MSAVMKAINHSSVLQAVDVKARLRNLLSEVSVTQTYVNEETVNIEAVYTIALPLDAVLLQLTVKLGDETLVGQVKAKALATQTYEDAITDGDSAVLLEYAGDGLYTINVGNLLPGETAVVMFRYAQLHHYQRNNLRFFFPTTIAPRYGDPLQSSFMPHQVPEISLAADHRFSFSLQLEGELADAQWSSPSHALQVSEQNKATLISLSDHKDAMDRDLIINFQRPQTLNAAPVLLGRDNDQTVALASFHLFDETLDYSNKAACIKMVIDCSGSMAGDSINQARQAVYAILDRLLPDDIFNITLFGSTHKTLFKKALKATDKHLKKARQFADKIDSEMGGTEIERALLSAIKAGGHADLFNNILLITDGEVYDHHGIIDSVKHSGHRIFSIGVGSAVSESFIKQIAQSTGGASELVSPRENMAERIVNQFERLRQPEIKNLKLQWPVHSEDSVLPPTEAVFLNDTLHVFGWFNALEPGEITLKYKLGKKSRVQTLVMPASVEIAADDHDDLARMGIARKITDLNKAKKAAKLAEQYQLVTQHSSCVLVKQRAEGDKADSLPVLRKVEHMMAAGSHGMGSLLSSPADQIQQSVVYCDYQQAPASKHHIESDMEFLDIPAFMRRQSVDDIYSGNNLVERLNKQHSSLVSISLKTRTFEDLEVLYVEPDLLDRLVELAEELDLEEKQAVVMFLYVLLQSDAGQKANRNLKRVVTSAWKKLPESVRELEEKFEVILV